MSNEFPANESTEQRAGGFSTIEDQLATEFASLVREMASEIAQAAVYPWSDTFGEELEDLLERQRNRLLEEINGQLDGFFTSFERAIASLQNLIERAGLVEQLTRIQHELEALMETHRALDEQRATAQSDLEAQQQALTRSIEQVETRIPDVRELFSKVAHYQAEVREGLTDLRQHLAASEKAAAGVNQLLEVTRSSSEASENSLATLSDRLESIKEGLDRVELRLSESDTDMISRLAARMESVEERLQRLEEGIRAIAPNVAENGGQTASGG